MTSNAPRETIAPSWTLGKLKESFPGVELALYAFFGVGSRERSGFAASERLDDLLRRHLVFDAERACARLDAMAAEDWEHAVTPQALHSRLGKDAVTVIDARSQEEHQRSRITGSRLLSAESVTKARSEPSRPVTVVCNDGSQAPAASRHLRSFGLQATHLKGGLTAWANHCDESFPINYPLQESQGRWHLLADSQTLRYRRSTAAGSVGWRVWGRQKLQAKSTLAGLLERLPSLRLVAVSPFTFAIRGDFTDLHQAIEAALPWVDAHHIWDTGGELSEADRELALIERVLCEEAPRILANHKGTVEIASYHNRALGLRLGGGCSGCASANITTQRELAAALYREVPLLDKIESV